MHSVSVIASALGIPGYRVKHACLVLRLDPVRVIGVTKMYSDEAVDIIAKRLGVTRDVKLPASIERRG